MSVLHKFQMQLPPQLVVGDSWVKPYFIQYKKLLALALCLGIVAAVFSSALMITAGYLISASASAPGAIMLLQFPLIFIRVFGVGRPPIKHIERYYSHDWVFKMSSLLRCDLWLSLEKGRLAARSRDLAKVLGLLSSDIAHIQNLYLRCIFPSVIAFALYSIILALAGLFSLPLFAGLLITLSSIVIIFPLCSLLVNGARSMKRLALQRRLYEEMTDSCLGMVDWQCSSRIPEQKAHLEDLCQHIDELQLAEFRFDHLRNAVAQLLFAVSILAILYSVAAHFAQTYSVFSLVEVDARLSYPAHWIAAWVLGFFPVIELFAPLSNSALEGMRHLDSIAALNRLERVSFDEKRKSLSVNSQRKLTEKDKQTCTHFDKNASPLIDISHLYFSYPGTKQEILHDINLEIAQGERLAILGKSGVGKSSLLSLMLGEYKVCSGKLKLGGIDAAELSAYHNYIAVLEQGSYLFNVSLAENLRIGKAEASDEELYEVLERIGLADKVKSMPQGINSIVQEAGFDFSGGERRRLCLARVLLQSCPLVVLDEPTAGLDAESEKEVLNTICELFSDATLIIITHNLSVLNYVDRVIYLSQGKLAFQGSPEQLKNTSEYYRKLLAFDSSVNLSSEV